MLDDCRSLVAKNPDLDRRSLGEVDELLSFASSSLNPCLAENGALDPPTFGISDFSELNDHSDSNDARSQTEDCGMGLQESTPTGLDDNP